MALGRIWYWGIRKISLSSFQKCAIVRVCSLIVQEVNKRYFIPFRKNGKCLTLNQADDQICFMFSGYHQRSAIEYTSYSMTYEIWFKDHSWILRILKDGYLSIGNLDEHVPLWQFPQTVMSAKDVHHKLIQRDIYVNLVYFIRFSRFFLVFSLVPIVRESIKIKILCPQYDLCQTSFLM